MSVISIQRLTRGQRDQTKHGVPRSKIGVFNKKSIPCNLVIIRALICSLRGKVDTQWRSFIIIWPEKVSIWYEVRWHLKRRDVFYMTNELYTIQYGTKTALILYYSITTDKFVRHWHLNEEHIYMIIWIFCDSFWKLKLYLNV